MEVEGIFAALKLMSGDQLRELKEAVEKELQDRLTRSGVFSFEVDLTADPRKGVPYAARLTWNPQEKKLEREFFDLEKIWGRKQVTVRGKIEARAGEVVEIPEGGSWRNDYRSWYVVTPSGQLRRVADVKDSRAKARAIQYLRGEIGLDELLEGGT